MGPLSTERQFWPTFAKFLLLYDLLTFFAPNCFWTTVCWQLCLIRAAMMSWTMSWVGCLLKDSELFTLFAENSQILLKISVIPILLTFIYLVALNLLGNNQLNSSLRYIIVTQFCTPLFEQLKKKNYLKKNKTFFSLSALRSWKKILVKTGFVYL